MCGVKSGVPGLQVDIFNPHSPAEVILTLIVACFIFIKLQTTLHFNFSKLETRLAHSRMIEDIFVWVAV